jgi:O-antigen/teichoic acid export membrane protein
MHRFIHTLASSYALLVVTALYSLASVPLGLHFLTKERFGLWSVVGQTAGYFALINLGIGPSAARLLIDHKDQTESGTYGGMILTGWLVLAVQGVIIFVLGWFLGPALSNLLAIPAGMRSDFVLLIRWQCAITMVKYSSPIFIHVLYAHQRYDVSNYSQILGTGVMLGVLWYALRHHCGVFSILWADAAGWLVGAVIYIPACFRLGLMPHRQAWGHPNWKLFVELFAYGRDVFLVSLGEQLVLASQIIVITRFLGLAAAAVWAVATKLLMLFLLSIWKLFDNSVPALAEMLVRHEHQQLRHRFRGLAMLMASIVGVAAVLLALCNAPFLAVWTKGQISWDLTNDLLLGGWLIVLVIQRCHTGFVLVTKDIRFMRYIYVLEGVVFVLGASISVRWGGLGAIIMTSIVCTSLLTTAYGFRRTKEYFGFTLAEIAVQWLSPMLRMLTVLVPLAITVWWLFRPAPDLVRLAGFAVVIGGTGALLLLRWGVTADMRQEVLRRVSPGWAALLGRFMAR